MPKHPHPHTNATAAADERDIPVDSKGNTPLHLAILENDKAKIIDLATTAPDSFKKMLFMRNRDDFLARFAEKEKGYTPLLSALYNHFNIYNTLIPLIQGCCSKEEQKNIANAEAPLGESPLKLALFRCIKDAPMLLLKLGATISPTADKTNKMTLLHEAVIYNNGLDIIEKMKELAPKAFVIMCRAKGKYGRTPACFVRQSTTFTSKEKRAYLQALDCSKIKATATATFAPTTSHPQFATPLARTAARHNTTAGKDAAKLITP